MTSNDKEAEAQREMVRVAAEFIRSIASGRLDHAVLFLCDPVKYRVSSHPTETVPATSAVVALDPRRMGGQPTLDGFEAIYDYGHPKVTLHVVAPDGKVRAWRYNFVIEAGKVSYVGLDPPIA
jgi:hypothetical protein